MPADDADPAAFEAMVQEKLKELRATYGLPEPDPEVAAAVAGKWKPKASSRPITPPVRESLPPPKSEWNSTPPSMNAGSVPTSPARSTMPTSFVAPPRDDFYSSARAAAVSNAFERKPALSRYQQQMAGAGAADVVPVVTRANVAALPPSSFQQSAAPARYEAPFPSQAAAPIAGRRASLGPSSLPLPGEGGARGVGAQPTYRVAAPQPDPLGYPGGSSRARAQQPTTFTAQRASPPPGAGVGGYYGSDPFRAGQPVPYNGFSPAPAARMPPAPAPAPAPGHDWYSSQPRDRAPVPSFAPELSQDNGYLSSGPHQARVQGGYQPGPVQAWPPQADNQLGPASGNPYGRRASKDQGRVAMQAAAAADEYRQRVAAAEAVEAARVAKETRDKAAYAEELKRQMEEAAARKRKDKESRISAWEQDSAPARRGATAGSDPAYGRGVSMQQPHYQYQPQQPYQQPYQQPQPYANDFARSLGSTGGSDTGSQAYAEPSSQRRPGLAALVTGASPPASPTSRALGAGTGQPVSPSLANGRSIPANMDADSIHAAIARGEQFNRFRAEAQMPEEVARKAARARAAAEQAAELEAQIQQRERERLQRVEEEKKQEAEEEKRLARDRAILAQRAAADRDNRPAAAGSSAPGAGGKGGAKGGADDRGVAGAVAFNAARSPGKGGVRVDLTASGAASGPGGPDPAAGLGSVPLSSLPPSAVRLIRIRQQAQLGSTAGSAVPLDRVEEEEGYGRSTGRAGFEAEGTPGGRDDDHGRDRDRERDRDTLDRDRDDRGKGGYADRDDYGETASVGRDSLLNGGLGSSLRGSLGGLAGRGQGGLGLGALGSNALGNGAESAAVAELLRLRAVQEEVARREAETASLQARMAQALGLAGHPGMAGLGGAGLSMGLGGPGAMYPGMAAGLGGMNMAMPMGMGIGMGHGAMPGVPGYLNYSAMDRPGLGQAGMGMAGPSFGDETSLSHSQHGMFGGRDGLQGMRSSLGQGMGPGMGMGPHGQYGELPGATSILGPNGYGGGPNGYLNNGYGQGNGYESDEQGSVGSRGAAGGGLMSFAMGGPASMAGPNGLRGSYGSAGQGWGNDSAFGAAAALDGPGYGHGPMGGQGPASRPMSGQQEPGSGPSGPRMPVKPIVGGRALPSNSIPGGANGADLGLKWVGKGRPLTAAPGDRETAEAARLAAEVRSRGGAHPLSASPIGPANLDLGGHAIVTGTPVELSGMRLDHSADARSAPRSPPRQVEPSAPAYTDASRAPSIVGESETVMQHLGVKSPVQATEPDMPQPQQAESTSPKPVSPQGPDAPFAKSPEMSEEDEDAALDMMLGYALMAKMRMANQSPDASPDKGATAAGGAAAAGSGQQSPAKGAASPIPVVRQPSEQEIRVNGLMEQLRSTGGTDMEFGSGHGSAHGSHGSLGSEGSIGFGSSSQDGHAHAYGGSYGGSTDSAEPAHDNNHDHEEEHRARKKPLPGSRTASAGPTQHRRKSAVDVVEGDEEFLARSAAAGRALRSASTRPPLPALSAQFSGEPARTACGRPLNRVEQSLDSSTLLVFTPGQGQGPAMSSHGAAYSTPSKSAPGSGANATPAHARLSSSKGPRSGAAEAAAILHAGGLRSPLTDAMHRQNMADAAYEAGGVPTLRYNSDGLEDGPEAYNRGAEVFATYDSQAARGANGGGNSRKDSEVFANYEGSAYGGASYGAQADHRQDGSSSAYQHGEGYGQGQAPSPVRFRPAAAPGSASSSNSTRHGQSHDQPSAASGSARRPPSGLQASAAAQPAPGRRTGSARASSAAAPPPSASVTITVAEIQAALAAEAAAEAAKGPEPVEPEHGSRPPSSNRRLGSEPALTAQSDQQHSSDQLDDAVGTSASGVLAPPASTAVTQSEAGVIHTDAAAAGRTDTAGRVAAEPELVPDATEALPAVSESAIGMDDSVAAGLDLHMAASQLHVDDVAALAQDDVHDQGLHLDKDVHEEDGKAADHDEEHLAHQVPSARASPLAAGRQPSPQPSTAHQSEDAQANHTESSVGLEYAPAKEGARTTVVA